jgi:hypothetical protein
MLFASASWESVVPDEGLITASFAARFGAKARSKNSFVEHLPPLIGGREDLQLDVTPLVVHGKMIMDEDAFNFITSNRDSKGLRLARQLADFYEGGVLEVKPLGQVPPDQALELDELIKQEIKLNRRIWRDEIRKGMRDWDELKPEYIRSYGPRYSRDLEPHYIVRSVLDTLDDDSAQLAAEVLEAITQDKSAAQRRLTDIAIRNVVGHVCTGMLNHERYGAPVYDWADMQRFLTLKDRVRASHRKRQDEVFRFLVFQIAHIDVQEMTNSQLIALLKDRKIGELRAYVREAALEGSDSALLDMRSICGRAVELGAVVVGRKRSFLTRLAVAGVKGNLPGLGFLLDAEGLESVVKTLDEFLKDSIFGSIEAQRADPMDRALKATYVLHKHRRL